MVAWLSNVLLFADWFTDLDSKNRFALIVVVIGCATGVLCTLVVFASTTINSIHRRRVGPT